MSTTEPGHLGKTKSPDGGSEDETVAAVENGIVVNHSGYRDQLDRQYSLLGLAGIAVTVDNAWVALGSSISVSIRTFLCHLTTTLLSSAIVTMLVAAR